MKSANLSLVAAAALAAASSLHAAAPPPFNCAANPLAALSGPYVFSVEGALPLPQRIPLGATNNEYAITGRFVASISSNAAGAPIGVLKVTATSVNSGVLPPGSVTRLETDVGGFQVNSNCTGGTIWFNLSSRPMAFDFWFFDSREQIFLVSNSNGFSLAGQALIAPSACPAGVTNPLQVLTDTFAFTAHGIANGTYYIAGTFAPAAGLLSITASSDLGGSVTRFESDTGSYTVYPDCSGGQFTYNLSSRPIQYDFWFVFGFKELYFISTNSLAVVGSATK